jgi:hypothetical protein
MQIALPSALALTADPIASLIDTAFIGHIGLCLFQKAFALCFVIVSTSVQVVESYVKDDAMHLR